MRSRNHRSVLSLPKDQRDEPASQIHEEFEGVEASIAWRPVTIVDARVPKRLELRVEVPVEDMARLARPVATVSAVPPRQPGPGARRSGPAFTRACWN